MTESETYLPWPGADEKIVIEEMLRDSTSGQWHECYEFVKMRVRIQAKNIPQDCWEDIANDSMMRISKTLYAFRFDSKLSTWIIGIVRSSLIDTYRKMPHVGQVVPLPGDPHDDVTHESEAFIARNALTAEDEYMMSDELTNALKALDEYISLHRNKDRNKQILEMVLRDGYSHAEAAQAVGCSAPVASHVVREAQGYVRKKLGHHR